MQNSNYLGRIVVDFYKTKYCLSIDSNYTLWLVGIWPTVLKMCVIEKPKHRGFVAVLFINTEHWRQMRSLEKESK